MSLTRGSRGELRALLARRLLDSFKLLAHVLDAGSTGVAHARSVTVVRVDSNQSLHVVGLHVLDNNVSGALALVVATVSTGAIQLSCIHHSESIDGDGSLAIVLNHLVLGLLGTTALDERISGSKDGNGVLQATCQYWKT